MRVSTQIAAIVLIGGGGYLGWSQWSQIVPVIGPVVAPIVAKVPGLDFLQPLLVPPPKQAGAPPQPGPGAGRGGPGGGAPLIVEVTTVGTGAIIEIAEAVGSTRAFESVVLTAKVSGTVEKISFVEGQEVKAGDELIRLDVAEKQADVEAARAQIQTAQAQRDETAQKLERAQALRKTGSGTEAQVADLTLQLRTIETNIAAAAARERSAAARLEDLSIRAPFDGRVGMRQISLGALLDNKVAVTTLDDVSKMRLEFAIPETLVTKIAIEAPVKAVSLAFPGRAFEGRVAVIDTRVDPVTRSARVQAIIPNVDAALKPGMFMNVSLQIAARQNAILVPEESVVAEGPRQIAFVVKDGKIDRRVVTIGQRQGAQVEVVAGLAVGETIVVRGVQRVRHGQPVQTKPAFPGQKGNPAAASPEPPNPGKNPGKKA